MNACNYSGEEKIIGGPHRRTAKALGSKNPFERVVGTLCVAGLLKQRLAALTDAAVGQLMFDLRLERPESSRA